MRVGIALHYVRRGKITGIERVGLCLVAGLGALDLSDVDVDVLASATAAKLIKQGGRIRTTVLPGDWRLVAEQCVLPAWSARRNVDVLHIPAFGGAFVHRVPFVLTIHDAVFWDMPSAVSTVGRYYYRPLVEHAINSRYLRAAVFPSTAARDAVLKHFPALARIAHVCSNAISLPRAETRRCWHERADGPFRILTVGTIEPRKNLPGMADAISALSDRLGRPVRWQVVGRKGWGGADDERALGHSSAEWLGSVDDDQLAELYRHADLYLSLSHLEGFNMPVVEAMSQGTPTVLSDLPVHREVAANGADYVTARDAVGAARVMHDLLTQPDRWNLFADAAWKQSQSFTPTALAARAIDVYRAAC